LNVFGPGLSIAHRGTIVINNATKIGANCRLHACVNIGTKAGYDNMAPKIGDNVYIGPGVKIFGNIEIADGIAIGANAVVNRSFIEPNITIAGVPAKKINDKGSEGLLIKATEILNNKRATNLSMRVISLHKRYFNP
jgi:serine O-acetyltransferase